MAKFSKTNPGATGEPIAKSNTKRRVMTEALMLALNKAIDEDGKPTKRITMIADKLAQKAAEGEIAAIKECFDRTEGKAAQAILLQGDEDNPVVTKIVMEIIE